MKHIILPPGVIDGLDVTEPTHYEAEERWKAVICTPKAFGVYVHADTRLEGLQISYAKACGVQGMEPTKPSIHMDDCWIHGPCVAGILTHGCFHAQHLLVEFCGRNPQFEHNTYFQGHVKIRKSIMWFASSWAFDAYLTNAHGLVEQCLIVGERAVSHNLDVRFKNCTIIGRIWSGPSPTNIQDGVDGNLVFPSMYEAKKSGVFVSTRHRSFWPKTDIGYGCYPYDERLTLDFAETLWEGGYMSSRHGGVQIGDDGTYQNAKIFRPFWPGDTYEEHTLVN